MDDTGVSFSLFESSIVLLSVEPAAAVVAAGLFFWEGIGVLMAGVFLPSGSWAFLGAGVATAWGVPVSSSATAASGSMGTRVVVVAGEEVASVKARGGAWGTASAADAWGTAPAPAAGAAIAFWAVAQGAI